MDNIFTELLEPVSLDEVCGVNLEDTGDLNNLEQLAKGKEETQFSEAEPADWKNILNESKGLFKKSKDLWVTSYIITALYTTEGFKGLNDGFDFFLELLNKYWNSLYPLIDEDDDDPYSFRLNVFKSLFSLRGLLYCNINNSVITNSRTFSNITIREAIEFIESKNEDKIIELHNSVKDSSEEQIKSIIENIDSILTYLNALMQFLNEKIGEDGNSIETTDFIILLRNVFDYLSLSLQEKEAVIENKNENINAEQGMIDKEDDTSKSIPKNTHEFDKSTQYMSKSSVNLQNIKGRNDIKQIFRVICDWYKINEPSSPVPLFIKRAESLVDKSFIDIIQNIAGNTIPQIQLLFGNALSSETGLDNSEQIYPDQHEMNENYNRNDNLSGEVETFSTDESENLDGMETF